MLMYIASSRQFEQVVSAMEFKDIVPLDNAPCH